MQEKNGLLYPSHWDDKKKEGKKWCYGIASQNQGFSLRKTKATNFSRGTSFNCYNVSIFFSKLHGIMTRYAFFPQSIENMDESPLITVQRPFQIVAEIGICQSGRATSVDRGQIVTILACVSASGNSILPILVCPRRTTTSSITLGVPPRLWLV